MFHQVILVGHLGRDPEMRYLPNGQPVTTFPVASNRRWTGPDGQLQEETIWFRVSVFGKLAEVCNEYLGKGRAVLVAGRLRPDENGHPRIWVGQDGTVRATYDVVADTVRFLGNNTGTETGMEPEAEIEVEPEAEPEPEAETEAGIEPEPEAPVDELIQKAEEELGAVVSEPKPVLPADLVGSKTVYKAGTPLEEIPLAVLHYVSNHPERFPEEAVAAIREYLTQTGEMF